MHEKDLFVIHVLFNPESNYIGTDVLGMKKIIIIYKNWVVAGLIDKTLDRNNNSVIASAKIL